MLPQPVGLFKLMLNWFCTSDIQGRELCWHDFMKCTFNIILCQDTCESICYKLGMRLNATKLYSLIPVWMTWIFTEGHRLTGKLELVKSFCCKVAWSNSNWWCLIMWGRWLWRSPVSMAHIDHLSVCISCLCMRAKQFSGLGMSVTLHACSCTNPSSWLCSLCVCLCLSLMVVFGNDVNVFQSNSVHTCWCVHINTGAACITACVKEIEWKLRGDVGVFLLLMFLLLFETMWVTCRSYVNFFFVFWGVFLRVWGERL